jgi:hypothetical protein
MSTVGGRQDIRRASGGAILNGVRHEQRSTRISSQIVCQIIKYRVDQSVQGRQCPRRTGDRVGQSSVLDLVVPLWRQATPR